MKFNYYIGSILMYSGLIGIGAGLAVMYIGKNFDVSYKSSNICLECNNKISNDSDISNDSVNSVDSVDSNDSVE